MSDLISRRKLLSKLNSTGCEVTFDLPVEEILGEDVDIDDFTMLIEDAVQVYRKMVIDAICNQPTAYDVDNVVEELENESKGVSRGYLGKDGNKYHKHYKAVKLSKAVEIVKQGGIRKDESQ